MEGTELTGPIVFKNAMKRIAYAAVLVPGELDHDGESVTAEKIEQSAHEWMEKYRNVDLMHTLNNIGVPVESYILPEDLNVTAYGRKMHLPKGTWILASKLSEETFKRVEKGELTGYSVMGIRRAALKEFEGAQKNADAAIKKTLLRDLGEDWVAAFVSVVDEPCVPKAKFFALKCVNDASLKEGRRFSKMTLSALRNAFSALQALLSDAEDEIKRKGGGKDDDDDDKDDNNKTKEVSDLTPEELKAIVDQAVKSAIDPLADRLDKIEQAATASASKGTDGDGGGGDGGGDQGGGDDAMKDIQDRLERLEEAAKKRSGSASKSLTGQDGDGGDKTTSPPDRDPFGRKRKGEVK